MGSDPEAGSIQCPGDTYSLKGTEELGMGAIQTGMGEAQQSNRKYAILDQGGLNLPTSQPCLHTTRFQQVGSRIFTLACVFKCTLRFPSRSVVILWRVHRGSIGASIHYLPSFLM